MAADEHVCTGESVSTDNLLPSKRLRRGGWGEPAFRDESFVRSTYEYQATTCVLEGLTKATTVGPSESLP